MIEKKSFTGGLSSDRDGAYLQPNQYLNALNIRVASSEEGTEGLLSNVKGNTLVSFSMPSGTNTCIGSITDHENSRVFYFVHNSNNDHMVLCYFHKEDAIRKVMEQDDFAVGEDGLNFSTSNLITGVGLNDDLLFFTDNSTEPKRINVERGLKKHDASYVQLKTYDTLAAYGELKDTHIALIRQAPILPPTTRRFKDASKKYNLIESTAFTFAYRFVYVDGEVSSLSPYSAISPRPNPDSSDSEYDYNSIEVSLPTAQTMGTDVLEVEYLVKFNEEASFSVFYTERNYEAIREHDERDIGLFHIFNNDSQLLSVADSEVARYASAVPVKAKGLECSRGRVFLGNTTEGLNNLNEKGLKGNTSISPNVQKSTGGTSGNYSFWELYYEDGASLEFRYIVFIKVQGSTADGYYSVASPNVLLTDSSDEYDDWTNNVATLPLARWASSHNLSGLGPRATTYSSMETYVGGLVPYGATLIQATEVSQGHELLDTAVSVTGLTTSSITLVEGLKLWKTNSSYRFGMVFMDKYGRQGRVIELTDDEGISIPSRGVDFSDVVKDMDWSLPTVNPHNYIPDWAHSYSFVRTHSLNKAFFIQFPVKLLKYSDDLDGSTVANAYDNAVYKYLQISIEGLSAINFGYTYSEGDLVTLHNLNTAHNGVEPITLRVAGMSGDHIYANVDTDLNGLNVTAYSVVAEVYSPRALSTISPYLEFGETYRVTNAGAANRTWSTSSGSFSGDINLKFRAYGSANVFTEVQSGNYQHANDWIQLTGRGFAPTRFQQIHKPTAISFSENRIAGSLLNGLSVFNALDEEVLPSEMGSINKLLFTSKTESDGNTMLAIGAKETASVYIGEAQLHAASGDGFIAVQTGVIGSSQVLRGSYGTIHPESVAEQNNRVYWLDALNGTIVQYDVNGLIPIGDGGIGSFFKERCASIVSEGASGCFGGFDPLEKEYLLTLPSVAPLNYEHLEDYADSLFNTDILGSNEDPYNGLRLTIPVALTKGKKYRVELGDMTGIGETPNTSTFDSITISYGVGDDEGTTSTTDKGGYLEFTSSKTQSSFNILIADTALTQQDNDDEMYLAVYEFRSSYYKMEDGAAKTIAYSERARNWSSFYSYVAENIQSVGTQLLTFKSGQPWKHNVNETRNNFYGVQYKSRVASISRQAVSVVKAFQTLAVEGTTPPSFTHFRTEGKYMDRDASGDPLANPTYSDHIQSSDLSDAEFRQYEGVYYASILRDRLQPPQASYNATAYDANMLSGEKLVNQFMLFTLEFDNTDALNVRFANIGFAAQRGHKL